MIMPELQSTISVVLPSKAVISARIIRKLGYHLYLQPLRDYEIVMITPQGVSVILVWPDENGIYEYDGTVTTSLTMLPLLVVAVKGMRHTIENRVHNRISVNVGLEYGMLRPDAQSFLTTTRDLSPDGLRFLSVFAPWTNLHLKMRLILASGDISLVSKVTRTRVTSANGWGNRQWDTAVKFVEINAQAHARIENFVQAHYQRQQQGRHHRSTSSRSHSK